MKDSVAFQEHMF